MKLFPSSKVYVIAPAGTASGGPEVLHQLAAYLRQRDVDAYMYYVPHEHPDPVPAVYRHYKVPPVDSMTNRPENILISPETMPLFQAKEIRRVLWWLSVDQWLGSMTQVLAFFSENPLRRPLPHWFAFQPDLPPVHWVQSEYARQFLMLNGIPESQIHFVSDYLNPVFLNQPPGNNAAARKDIVTFNPLKGKAFTRKLTDAAPDIDWRPIQNMTPEEVRSLLRTAKVYIDFGAHPGKDRIPREAAISGCCLITGRRGAAANDVDVPIGGENKFADRDEDIPAIIARIRYLLAHYEEAYPRFATYRETILGEPARFAAQVDAALELPPLSPKQ